MTLATLHIIPYLAWEREGVESFDSTRARLLDTLTALLERMETLNNEKPLSHVLLGGQTVMLEDIAAVRPDLVALLVINNARGRLLFGPWYVPVDETLVSGEALIRNLLMARGDARQQGISLLNIAYLPYSASHSAQLPQILRGFGMDSAFISYTAPVPHLPFRWQAPDGSSILAVSHDFPQNQSELDEQKALEPDGPLLWMHAVTEEVAPPSGEGIPASQRALGDYFKALRKSMPDVLRPALHGELRLHTMRPYAYLLPGTLSTRIYLKQANARQQAYLNYVVEPLLAVTLTHAKVDFPDNQRALLNHAWRTLIRNQARNRLGGTSSDPVHLASEDRFHEVEDTSAYIVRQALDALYDDKSTVESSTRRDPEIFLIVWNAHGRALRQVVEVELVLPEGKHPLYLLAADGEELAFGWQRETKRLSFVAQAPSVGYATYTLRMSDKPTPDHYLTSTVQSALIGSTSGETLALEGEQLVWKRGDHALNDVLRFVDGGDAGDAFNFSPPDPDIIVQAVIGADTQIESSPAHQRLIMRARMRIAPALRPNRGRDRGLKTLDLLTTATFYESLPGIYFNVQYSNTAADHRLRAYLRTGLASNDVLSDSAFALIKRPVKLAGAAFPTQQAVEGMIATYPMHTVAAVESEGRAMAVLSRGLYEFEPLTEGGQTTLALTLLRAVGWLSRGDLRTRTANVAPSLAIPGAQCLREMQAEFALLPMSAKDAAGMLHAGQAYNAPLQVYQVSQKPKTPQQSYLTLETTSSKAMTQDTLLTALKPPQTGKGWIVRLHNPTERVVETALLTAGKKVKFAERVNLAEETQAELEADETGKLKVRLEPHKLVTLRLAFD
jgi:alpha-mannosidase/mannosylglycerate hydrolase